MRFLRPLVAVFGSACRDKEEAQYQNGVRAEYSGFGHINSAFEVALYDRR
jgi:hypothetical protein